MIDIIPITWYIESPIDFEHKQYVLLSYLQIVDGSFIDKKLSPHLLHMERMINEMTNFRKSFSNMKMRFDKERYMFFEDNSKLDGEKNELLEELIEIVDFSLPQVVTRINLGKSILHKNRQILY